MAKYLDSTGLTQLWTACKNTFLTQGAGDERYLKLSGGTLSGNLTLNSVLKVCEPDNPLSGKVHTKLLCYSTSPYGIVFRGYSNGVHSLQVQRESNDSETFNLSLQPLGGNVGIGTTSPNYKLDVSGSLNATTVYQNGTQVSVIGHTHSKSEVGLGNVDNTADVNKSVSSANKLVNQETTNCNSAIEDRKLVYYASISQTSGIAGTNGFPTNLNSNGLLWVGTHPSDGGGLYGHQIGFSGNGSIYQRTVNNGSWSSWIKLVTSSNYSDYTVTKTGSGASGTWGINVTGSAGSVAWSNVSGKPDSYTPATHNHDSNYLKYSGVWSGSESHDSTTATGMVFAYYNHGVPGTWGTLTTFSPEKGSNYNLQLFGDGWSNEFYFRTRSSDNGQHEWRKVIHEGNIGSQSVDYASSAGSVAWDNISGKPSTFTPSSHTHNYIDQVLEWNNPNESNIVDLNTQTNSWGTKIKYSGWGFANYTYVSNYYTTSAHAGSVWTLPEIYGGLQLAAPYSSSVLYFRKNYNGSWDSWVNVITSANIGSQRVSYAGSAGSVAWSNVSGKPDTFTPSSHNHDSVYLKLSNSTEQVLSRTTIGDAPLTIKSGTGTQAGIKYIDSTDLVLGYIGVKGGSSPYPYFYDSTYRKIWHEGNDGSGSGLDADTLDGNHASAFATAGHTHSYLPLSGGTLTGSLDIGSSLRICEPSDPLSGKVHTKLLCYSSSPYGMVFRGYASGTHSIQVQRESNDSERFNLALQPLGGNVGIGTTSPSQKLEVNGTAKATGYIGQYLYDGGTDFWIGATKDALGSGSGCTVYAYGNKPIYFYTNSSRRATITGAGNFGIGTDSPAYKLDVSGSFNATTIYQNGSALSSLFWNSGNDGSGSGLDADLLDGKHLSDIQLSNGRNLIRGYDIQSGPTSGYMVWNTHTMTETVAQGDKVTITLEYSLDINSTKTWLSVYTGGGYASIASYTATPGLDHYVQSITTTMSYASGHNDNGICIYYGPSGNSGIATIHRVKIERGDHFTGWTAAPEDIPNNNLINSEIDAIMV